MNIPNLLVGSGSKNCADDLSTKLKSSPVTFNPAENTFSIPVHSEMHDFLNGLLIDVLRQQDSVLSENMYSK